MESSAIVGPIELQMSRSLMPELWFLPAVSFREMKADIPVDYPDRVTQDSRPSVSIEFFSRVDVAQIFQSLGEYIAIHEPVVDEFGTLTDAQLIWWNRGYESVRVLPVSHLSRMSEAYFDPRIAIEYASTAWSSGRSIQLFEFIPAHRNQYRPPGQQVAISVLWERVGDYVVEIGSDLSELRKLEHKLADQKTLVFAAERDKAILAERERIARDLHDSVIQQIYAASLALNAVATTLKGFSTGSDDAHAYMHSIITSIANDQNRLISTIRDEIFAVQQIARVPLRRSLEDVVLPIIGPSAMDFDMHIQLADIDDGEILSHVKAVIREAVSNSVRHSSGSTVKIALHRLKDSLLHLVIADDGVGIPEELPRSSGLANIEERARALGGKSEIVRQVEGGTRVSWWVPVPGWMS